MPRGCRSLAMSAFPEPAMAEVGGKPPRNWRAFSMLLGLITIPLIAIDQFSKIYISTHMSMWESIPIIPNWFDITYTQNPGAAFSMFANFPPIFRTVFLFALSTIAIVVLLVMIAQTGEVGLQSIAFALVLAGAAGNLIDRAIRGRVIDFIRVHYYDSSYPIFIVADSAITIGVILIILSTFFSKKETSTAS
jgi:signal peptidase II